MNQIGRQDNKVNTQYDSVFMELIPMKIRKKGASKYFT